MVHNVQVTVGDHRATPVPPAATHNVDLRNPEGICGTDNRTDVEVVTKVLNGNFKPQSPASNLSSDGIPRPVTELVLDISVIALDQQIHVPLVTIWVSTDPRTDTPSLFVGCLLLHISPAN